MSREKDNSSMKTLKDIAIILPKRNIRNQADNKY